MILYLGILAASGLNCFHIVTSLMLDLVLIEANDIKKKYGVTEVSHEYAIRELSR